MKFTQFLRPNGRRATITIDMPESVEALATELSDAGWSFEIEQLTTGHIHGDCCNNDGQLAQFVAGNGPGIPDAVQSLVEEAHSAWVEFGKPAAGEFEFPSTEPPCEEA